MKKVQIVFTLLFSAYFSGFASDTVPIDRCLEIDLYWFEKSDMNKSAKSFWGRYYPLMSSLNPLEIEAIVILNDALSNAMYGAQGDLGVILIKSRRGEADKREIRIAGQYSTSNPRALPKYLNAADYLAKYNEAQLNDGIAPSSLRYTGKNRQG